MDKQELEVGTYVELEHYGDERDIQGAKKIAIDHLKEDPTYYSKLYQAGLIDEPKAIELAKKYFKDNSQYYMESWKRTVTDLLSEYEWGQGTGTWEKFIYGEEETNEDLKSHTNQEEIDEPMDLNERTYDIKGLKNFVVAYQENNAIWPYGKLPKNIEKALKHGSVNQVATMIAIHLSKIGEKIRSKGKNISLQDLIIGLNKHGGLDEGNSADEKRLKELEDEIELIRRGKKKGRVIPLDQERKRLARKLKTGTSSYVKRHGPNKGQPIRKEGTLDEGAMSELDLMAKESKNLSHFLKQAFKFMGGPKDKETIKWLTSMYKNAIKNESMGLDESMIADIETMASKFNMFNAFVKQANLKYEFRPDKATYTWLKSIYDKATKKRGKNESVNEGTSYDTKSFKKGDKVKLLSDTWEVVETNYKPGKKFKNPFVFMGKDMKFQNVKIPYTNSNAVGYKVRTQGNYPMTGFMYKHGNIIKLATVGVNENITEGNIRGMLGDLGLTSLLKIVDDKNVNGTFLKTISKKVRKQLTKEIPEKKKDINYAIDEIDDLVDEGTITTGRSFVNALIEKVYIYKLTEGVNETITEDVITEGINDPGILKAIFLAGGPGSGKSFAVQNVLGVPEDIMKGVSTLGLKVINSDSSFERNLKSQGIDPKMLDKLPKDVFDKLTKGPDSAREKAKRTTKKLQKMFETERLGMIIDGTGHNYSKISKMKKRLDDLGYDTAMLFVNTRLDTAKDRNSKRERVVPEDILTKSWNDVQDNIGKFQSLFGNDFKVIDNNDKVPGKTSGEVTYNFEKMNKDKVTYLKKMVSSPVKNPRGRKWVELQKKARGIK